MNWKSLISSPPPDTVWSLDNTTVAVVNRDRKVGNRMAAVEMPSGAVELGPAGVSSFDGRRLPGVLESLDGRIKGSRRAAVVIPTRWVRCFLMEAEDLPKRRSDLQDVLRWRLKKLLPVPPADLRLSAALQTQVRESRQILCAVAPERALAQLESAFADIGVVPGLIVPRVLALTLDCPVQEGPATLIVQQEEGALSMVLVEKGGIRLIRTKPLPVEADLAENADREIALAVHYVRAQMGCAGPITARIAAASERYGEAVHNWLNSQDGITGEWVGDGGVCPDGTLAATLGAARLSPMAAVLRGGAP